MFLSQNDKQAYFNLIKTSKKAQMCGVSKIVKESTNSRFIISVSSWKTGYINKILTKDDRIYGQVEGLFNLTLDFHGQKKKAEKMDL